MDPALCHYKCMAVRFGLQKSFGCALQLCSSACMWLVGNTLLAASQPMVLQIEKIDLGLLAHILGQLPEGKALPMDFSALKNKISAPEVSRLLELIHLPVEQTAPSK